jgi:hypothetical protein
MEQIRAGVSSARGAIARRALPTIPEGVRDEVNESIRRFASIRTPKDLLTVVEEETGRLSEAVVPVLAQHPLPIRGQRQGEVVAAFAAAAGATIAELDELAVLFTDGVAAPTIPFAGGGLVVAFVLELWIAVSTRVHAIERAGRAVDPEVLSAEVAASLLGIDMNAVKQLSKRGAKAIGKRMAKRWALGLAPVAGIVIDGAAARRTVAAIGRLPMDDHPRRVRAIGA